MSFIINFYQNVKKKKMKKVLIIAIAVALASVSHGQTTFIRTVVHVMYTNVSQDISDATVTNYIQEVNKGYAKQLAPKFLRSPDIFGPDWVNTNIQLCLASTDPNGNTTNGITHTLITDKFSPSQNPDAPANPVWNPNNYLNIYLVPVYAEPGFPGFVLGGWASTPTNPQMGATFEYVLVSSNSIPFITELITHETGHYFGLDHVSDDLFADTPKGMEAIFPSTGYSPNCSISLQTQNTSTLAQDGNHWGGVDPPDMVENFMGLSFCCQFMFTTMQKNQMLSYINTHHSNKTITTCASIPTEIHQLNIDENMVIFPNPSEGLVNILPQKDLSQYELEVIDYKGQVLLKNLIYLNSNPLDLSMLSNGLYILKFCEVNTMREFRKKLIISKK